MTKPVIVTRAGKGAPLTRAELDANFQNIDNANIGISDGTNSGTLDLNDQLTFAATGSLTATYDALTKTLTLGSSGGSGTVTSVSGTGTVNGLTLSGTVTSSGNLTLGGTLSLSSPPAIGSVAPSTGAFTTLSASSTVSGTGFSTYLASPPPIGGTTASTIRGTTITATTGFSGPLSSTLDTASATTQYPFFSTASSGNGTVKTDSGFTYVPSTGVLTATQFTGNTSGTHSGAVAATTLSASSTVSGTGFSTYLASPPAIGGTTPSTGKFTTLTATGTTTLATSLGGLLKATAGVVSAATAGTDYQSPIGTISGLVKGNGANALTAAVAGTDYVAPGGALGTPSSGTVTNLTGTASININGTVGATTPSTGAFTTISATTTGTTGALSITYNPATAAGSAINATGKNSQGGTGYFDFLKVTNTSTGATNPSKTIRINSTGGLEIVDSTYTNIRFALTDAGQMTVGGTNFPTSTGTNGQVLTANGSGGSSWTTISSGGATSLSGLSDVDPNLVGGAGSYLGWNTSTSKWAATALPGYLSAISGDTNPRLGGNLDVSVYSLTNSSIATDTIITTSYSNISLTPAGIVTSSKSIQLNAQSELRLADSDSSNYVGFKSPATVTTNKVWTLPSADGTSGQMLKTDGAGTLSWATVSSGLPQAIISCPGATAFVNTKRISWTTENSDPSNLLTLTSASGYFTLAAAGTYLLEQPMLFTMTDSNSWNFRNETTASVLTNFAPATYGSTVTFTPWFYIFTVAGTNNNFSFQNSATVATNIPSTVYLRITKLA